MSVSDQIDELEIGDSFSFSKDDVEVEFNSLANLERVLKDRGCICVMSDDEVVVTRVSDSKLQDEDEDEGGDEPEDEP